MDQAQRDRLAETIASTLGTCRPDIKERVFEYWRNVDKAVGDAVAELVNGPGVEPHGPAPASDDPDTPVNKDVVVDEDHSGQRRPAVARLRTARSSRVVTERPAGRSCS